MVDKNIYNKLIKSRNNNEIVVPTFKGQQGNPVLFSISMKEKIMSIQGDNGAKKIINMHENKTYVFETNDQSIIQDFNTQESFS